MSEQIQDNYKQVRAIVDETCKRVGRKPEDVTLIAVSKTKPLSDIEKLIKIGVIEFGENKPQELREKFDNVSTPVRFHQIGHLQTNKIKYIINKTVLIHSVDSLKLAQAIEKEAAKRDIHVNVLIEVNYSGEKSKFGIPKDEALGLIQEIASSYRHIHIRGLMTIAPLVDDPEQNRPIFKGMHELLLDIKSQNIDNVDMSVLSMGMTQDYVVAIEVGATMIRVGTAIFGERDYK
jgi:pyridoxal phosphate enzyme (YggS family)